MKCKSCGGNGIVGTKKKTHYYCKCSLERIYGKPGKCPVCGQKLYKETVTHIVYCKKCGG